MSTPGEKLDSGLPMVGRLPPGSRLCQFYENPGELLELVPSYLKAGLENGEFCVWAPPPALGAGAARKAAAGCRKYAGKGQLEIVPAERWNGLCAAPGGALSYCLARAGELGFKGLRLACPAPHPEDGGYSEKIAAAGALALFAYPRADLDAAGLLETAMSHNLALLRNAGRWEVLESREARLTSDALKRSEEKLDSLFNNMSEGFALHRIVVNRRGEPCDYVFLEVNEAFEAQTGLKAADIVGKRATQVIPGLEKEHAGWIKRYGKVALTGRSDQFESYSEALGKHFLVSAFSTQRGYFAAMFQDVTERVRAEEERKITVDFLRLVNEAVSSGELLRRAADFFHERSGCEAFAIRLRDGGDYPYREARGFKPGFAAAESSLCSGGSGGRPCLCGAVLDGGRAGDASFTAHGSFWTGSLPGLESSSPGAAALAAQRGRCAAEGYRSLALVPFHLGEERLGLLQFNYRRADAFTAGTVALWERLADQLAVALAKFRAEESYRWGDQRNLLLSRSAALLLGAEDPQASVDIICASTMRFLDCQVFFNYLSDPASGRLHLNACRGIPKKEAARIEWLDYGKAVCGCVARDGERIIASDIQSPGFDPRAALVRSYGVRAYCCHPLKSGKEVFGTISFGTTARNAFTDKEISMMEDTAAMVAVAMRRKKADEVVRRDKETLKELVEAQAGSLMAAREELERAKRLSDIGTLAATVAHELRNPLATIGMAASNIKRKAASPDLEKHLVNIDKKVFESNQIINNLLFYSRLKLPHYETVSVHDVLAESAENAVRSRKEGVELSIKTGCLKDEFLEADPLQLREVANNLLDNAYDAVAPRGGRITVTGASGADWVEFTVADNGQGVEEAILARVFDPFFTTKAKGTGLGLSVCRQIADFHGGTIVMKSVPGKGAAVTVRLPRKRRADAA
jgi:PAS domain S-box-containing protein